ncbi:hypothetical protein BBF96_02380 [Anoxybacter fermentans]|uniref:Uncharacterized protein n=1 Tax=Anoxybacter fermentans TaxID=1323375 RepID=A0A3Q9HNW2_9FIRM|nr:hypothetical protein BBF96_02380 [Anoxybacter fermentans]
MYSPFEHKVVFIKKQDWALIKYGYYHEVDKDLFDYLVQIMSWRRVLKKSGYENKMFLQTLLLIGCI